jgi:hypothetical protein
MKSVLSNTVDVKGSERYLRQCLESGRVLSESVAKRLSAWKGRSCVVVPESVNGNPPTDFRYGGFCSRDEAIEALAAHLSDRVRLFGSAIVFEHSLALPGDAAVKRNPLQKLYLNNCVYFVAPHEEQTSFESMIQSIHSASTADAFRAFVLPIELLQDSASAKEDGERLNALAASVESIVVGVFDNESFLIWQRKS